MTLVDNTSADSSELVRRSVGILEAFRATCLRGGYKEINRVSLVSNHDPSIRFTNSTISVLKSYLDARVEQRLFLMQPSLRLRNMVHWRKLQRMSGFGCYFIAFGTLCPASNVTEVHRDAISFLVDGLGVSQGRILLRVSSDDADLIDASTGLGIAVEYDGYEQYRYRHRFGLDGVTGRNSNIAIRTHAGYSDVANVIVIERNGEPIAVEMAFGVNMVLAQIEQLSHPVLASVGALAQCFGITDLISLDSIGSAIALTLERLKSVSRGRGGNLRAFLGVLAEDRAIDDERLFRAALAVAEGESAIREHASPLVPNTPVDQPAAAVAEAVTKGVQELRDWLPAQ